MACILTQGWEYECNNGAGGVKQGSLLISNWDYVAGGATITAGEITALVQDAGTSFKRYNIRKEIVAMDSTSTTDPLTGSNVNEAVVTAALYKLSKTKNTELKLAQGTPLMVIIQDNNDVYHAFGYENGAELLTVQAMTGKALSEMNGYNLSFTAREQNRYTVASALMATILVEGENS
jgi:hypothetical protein